MASLTMTVTVLVIFCTMTLTSGQDTVAIDANAAVENLGNGTDLNCNTAKRECLLGATTLNIFWRKNLQAAKCVGSVIDEQNGACSLVKDNGCTAEWFNKLKDGCSLLKDPFYKKLVAVTGACQKKVRQCLDSSSNMLSAIRFKDDCTQRGHDLGIRGWDCVLTGDQTTLCTKQEHADLVATLKNCLGNSGRSVYTVSMVTVLVVSVTSYLTGLIS